VLKDALHEGRPHPSCADESDACGFSGHASFEAAG
jgi:hypothetical protein